MDTSTFQQYLPFLVPLFLVQLGLMIAALLDWARGRRTRGSKWLWLLLILTLNIIGPVLYLLVGRRDDDQG